MICLTPKSSQKFLENNWNFLMASIQPRPYPTLITIYGAF